MASIISAGTTSGTSLNLSGDTSGVLQLATNGSTTAVTITTAQNVGIGTASPAYALDVRSTAAPAIRLSRSGTAGQIASMVFEDGNAALGSGSTTRIASDSGAMSFSTGGTSGAITGGTERMRIDASGNVGIGETSPAGSANYTQLVIRGTNGAELSLKAGATQYGYIYGDSGGLRIINPQSGASSGTMQFFTSNTERMRITSGGNVAIATSSSQSGLEIYRANSTTGSLTDASLMLSTTATTGRKVNIGFGLGAGVANTCAAVIGYDVTNGAGAGLGDIFFSTRNTTADSTPTERMRITSAGRVFVAATDTPGGSNPVRFAAVNTAAGEHVGSFVANTTSYGSQIFILGTTRTATSGFNLAGWYSGDGGSIAFQDAEFIFRGDGQGYADGTWNNNGADYAEFFESVTGQSIPVGSTVALENNKVRLATESDNPADVIGVVRPKEPSKASMVVGNTAWNKWANKYLTDDFDRYIMEDHDVVEWTDADGKQHSYESHNIPEDITVPADAIIKTHDDKGIKFQHYKLNPAWDPNAEYVNRENRDEWLIIGLVGQVKVLKGQVMGDRWKKMRDVSSSVEEWFIR